MLFSSPLFGDPALPFALDPTLSAVPEQTPSVSTDSMLELPTEMLSSTPAPLTAPSQATTTADIETRVSALIDRALSLVERAPWFRDFLFADAPAADVAMLTAPTALAAACYAQVRETSVELSGAHSGALDSAVTVQWALIPAFCAGDVTAGVAVTTVQQRSAHARSPQNQSAHGRFFRDERSGEVLLYRHESNSEASIVHMSLSGSTARDRVYLRFRGALHSAPPTAANVAYACATSEHRFCPRCSAPPASGCACTLHGHTPAHPLDFADCRTMSNHCGEFSGRAVASIMRGAPGPSSAHMLTRAVVTGGKDGASVAALAAWAVRARLNAISPATDALLAPPFAPAVAQTSSGVTLLDSAVLGLSTSPVACGLASSTTSSCGVSAGSAQSACDPTGDPASHLLMASYVQGGGFAARKAADAGCGQAAITRRGVVVETGAVLAGGPLGSMEVERALRKHQRKLRNRMAAARSNQKRKEKYLNLQRDVSDIRERKTELTRRLEQLQAENGSLRARMSQ